MNVADRVLNDHLNENVFKKVENINLKEKEHFI